MSSTGSPPASTIASVRPAWPMTLVFAVPSPMPWRGPGVVGQPFVAVTPSSRTNRLRYHSARPSADADAVHHPGAREPVVASADPAVRPGSARCGATGR